jgi:cytochrome c oxidase cbb3-type subunit 2
MTPSPASLIDLKMCITRFVRTCKASGAAIVVLLAIGVATAQTNSAQHDSSVYAELAKAPKKAVDRHNPMEADPDAVAAGGKLFGQHCAECHGEMAEGGKKGPSLRAGEVQRSTPGTLFWLLTNGVVRRGMPVWSKLPEPQRWQLVTYIKSLAPAPQPSPTDEKPARP